MRACVVRIRCFFAAAAACANDDFGLVSFSRSPSATSTPLLSPSLCPALRPFWFLFACVISSSCRIPPLPHPDLVLFLLGS